jgi:hypothetical protein
MFALTLGNVDCPLLGTGGRCISVKIHWAEAQSVFCALEVVQLCAVVLFVVRAVGLFQAKHLTDGVQWK